MGQHGWDKGTQSPAESRAERCDFVADVKLEKVHELSQVSRIGIIAVNT